MLDLQIISVSVVSGFVVLVAFIAMFAIGRSIGHDESNSRAAVSHESNLYMPDGCKSFHAPCGCRMQWCAEHSGTLNGPDAWIEEVRDGEYQKAFRMGA